MTPDNILWINHAGYELRAAGLRIVFDPWIDGLAFANSWALLSPSRYTAADFEGVDYIWFSHEHPDHFSPDTLKRIAPETRAGITILFQATRDQRVVSFCRKLGFKVRELAPWARTPLSNGVFITTGTVGRTDSWCYVETPSQTYLNMNDCILPKIEDHSAIAGRLGPVGVLLTQFSYANWSGNPGDSAAMRKAADRKLQQMTAQIAAYRPKVLIPFASFVWFCRADNFHLNQGANTIGAVYERFSSKGGYDVVTLYPGDRYIVGSHHDSANALALYAADRFSHREPLQVSDPAIGPDELLTHGRELGARIHRDNWLWALWPLKAAGYIKPVNLYLTDLNEVYEYSLFDGLRRTPLSRTDADIECPALLLDAALRHGYGYSTLFISGRLLERKPGSVAMLSRNFAPLRYNEVGLHLPRSFIGQPALWPSLLRTA